MHDPNIVVDKSKNERERDYLKGNPAGKCLPSLMKSRSMQEGSQWKK